MPFVVPVHERLAHHVTKQRIPYEHVRNDLPLTTAAYAAFNMTNGFDRAALWLFKSMSPLTPFRNPIASDLVSNDLMDTTDGLAYITKDFINALPGAMGDGAFQRADNIANEAATRGLIAQIPNSRFPNYYDLFENAQSFSSDV
jgi:hypothetical protein